ncbi:MAG TPA: hypothetical protein VGB77_07925, partial [Abditibacteriaceae bacterium]
GSYAPSAKPIGKCPPIKKGFAKRIPFSLNNTINAALPQALPAFGNPVLAHGIVADKAVGIVADRVVDKSDAAAGKVVDKPAR